MNVKIYVLLGFFALSAICNADENPMPLTQNNITKLDKIKINLRNNIAPSPGQDYDFIQAKITKDAIENLGYDADKTIRASALFHDEIGFMGLNPLYGYVFNNPQKALSEKLISDKTFEIINKEIQAEKGNYNASSKKSEEFISLVESCMKTSKDGFCTQKEIVSIWQTPWGKPCVEDCGVQLDMTFELSKLQWVFVDKNNKPIQYFGRYIEKVDAPFKTNKEVIDKMNEYQSMKNEQKSILFPK